MSITTETVTDGVLVRFPKDREMIASLKKTFPRARWNPGATAWLVEGKTAEKRVAKWMAEIRDAKAAAEKAEADARANLAEDAVRSRYVAKWSAGWRVSTPYDDAIVRLLRSIPSASFHREEKGGYWLVPFRDTALLAEVLPRIEALADPIMAERKKERERREAEKAELRAEYAREREARDVERSAHRANRFVVLLEDLPETGKPVRMFGRPVVVESFGKTFRVNEDMPSMWGSHLLGHEGRCCCYAYWREAAVDEVADLESRERAAAQAAAERRAATEEMRRLAEIARTSGEYPQGDHRVDGETLLEDRPDLRIYGGGCWWVATDDHIWYVQNNGADGDAWSHNNVRTGGAGAIGWRLPRDPETEGRLRHIAGVLARR